MRKRLPGLLPNAFIFSEKKISVKCLKTQPCAFNCLDGFSFCFFDNHILVHLILQLLPKLQSLPSPFLLTYLKSNFERLLFLSHFFGLSTSSVSDLAFVPKDQTWVVDEQTQVYVLTELIIWQLFLVLAQQLSCPVGGKTNKHYKLKK